MRGGEGEGEGRRLPRASKGELRRGLRRRGGGFSVFWHRAHSEGSTEAALSAVGPEEMVATERIQKVLRRVKEVCQPARANPETIKAEAVAKVERLQKSFGYIGLSWRTRGRCHQESSQEGRLKMSHENDQSQNCERVKECKDFRRAFHQAYQAVAILAGRDESDVRGEVECGSTLVQLG